MISRRSPFLVFAIVLLSACSGMGELQAKPDRFQKKGTYRKDGTCTLMQKDTQDLTPLCNAYIGVITLEDGHPRFVFSQQQGEFWAFSSNGPATKTDKGRVTIYPISHIYEMSTTRNLLYKGECRLSMDGEYEDIACTTWTDDSRSQTAWRATFVGTGSWRYQNK